MKTSFVYSGPRLDPEAWRTISQALWRELSDLVAGEAYRASLHDPQSFLAKRWALAVDIALGEAFETRADVPRDLKLGVIEHDR